MSASSRRASTRVVQTWILGALGVSACQAGEAPVAAPAKGPELLAVRVAPAGSAPRGIEPTRGAVVTLALEADGRRHRPAEETCKTHPDLRCADVGNGCHSDADCNAEGTTCVLLGTDYCGCQAGCTADADCANGTVCTCGSGARSPRWDDHIENDGHAACVPGNCRTDADCSPSPGAPATGECRLVPRNVGCGTAPYFTCSSDRDTCKTDADCREGLYCIAIENGPHGSGGLHCAAPPTCWEGRPLFVEDAPQVARLLPLSGAWSRRYSFSSVTPDARFAAAAARAAAEEHASIGAFARTIVELIALGAPPDLLRETQEALADEIRHAELAFALARAAGSPQEPGPFPAATAAFSSSSSLAADLARSVLRGGCFGETEAAIRLLERAFAAKSAPAPEAPNEELAAFYTDLSHDEARHAALAFRTLRWLVDAFPSDVLPVVAGATIPASVAPIVAPLLAELLGDSIACATRADAEERLSRHPLSGVVPSVPPWPGPGKFGRGHPLPAREWLDLLRI